MYVFFFIYLFSPKKATFNMHKLFKVHKTLFYLKYCKARFILPANANAKRMLTSQIRNKYSRKLACARLLQIFAAKTEL